MAKKYAVLPLHRAEQTPAGEACSFVRGCERPRLFLMIVAQTCRFIDPS
jgi:hypothetical protein